MKTGNFAMENEDRRNFKGCAKKKRNTIQENKLYFHPLLLCMICLLFYLLLPTLVSCCTPNPQIIEFVPRKSKRADVTSTF
jgi:hypothetical protein